MDQRSYNFGLSGKKNMQKTFLDIRMGNGFLKQNSNRPEYNSKN